MQRARVSNHPCHRLSVPAAKRFWCRHCMMVFEDAITRWRHSRSCRSGGFDNFVRRREIETQALQQMAETLDPEMMTSVAVSSGDGGAGCSKELCCFICRERFVSLDEMREHVKYPCNKPASLQRPSMTVYIEEPTFGTGIQHHYTDGLPYQTHYEQHGSSTAPAVSASGSGSQPVTLCMSESEQGHQNSEAKPTNIYVNEKGETVIEVENLDLNTKSGELSLAHLLTQLSQQGIVFDQQSQSNENEISVNQQEAQVQESAQDLDLSQPTAVDAANTLTQLAGSAFRAASNSHETYAYASPPAKRIKTEVEFQYPVYQQEHVHVQTYLQKDEQSEESEQEKFIICTNESEVISVVRADRISPENSTNSISVSAVIGRNHSSDVPTSANASAEEIVVFQNQSSEDRLVNSTENGTEANFSGSPVIMLQEDQAQVQLTTPLGLVKTENSIDQLIITHNASRNEQTGEVSTDTHYSTEENTVTAVEGVDATQEQEVSQCPVMSAENQETSENILTGFLQSTEGPSAENTEATQINSEAVGESVLLVPQIESVSSSIASASHVIVQNQDTPDVLLPP